MESELNIGNLTIEWKWNVTFSLIVSLVIEADIDRLQCHTWGHIFSIVSPLKTSALVIIFSHINFI